MAIVIKQCKVLGCVAPNCVLLGKPHYCKNCEDKDSNHSSRTCPKTRCRVKGCRYLNCMKGYPHYCKNCGNTDSDHFSRFCQSTRINSIASINTGTGTKTVTETDTGTKTVTETDTGTGTKTGTGSSIGTGTRTSLKKRWVNEGIYTSSISVGTMCIFYKKDGILKAIITFRGVNGPKKNTFTTSGGTIDLADNVQAQMYGCEPGVIAAIRETKEELGINIKSEDIFYQFNKGYFCNVFAFVPNFHPRLVTGPEPRHLWEITPFKGINVNTYIPLGTSHIDNIYHGLIFGIPVESMFTYEDVFINSHMKPLYLKIKKLESDGLLFF
jgi:8-oxo-dGTP pyrophosphatase MutT (NUDIX family)